MARSAGAPARRRWWLRATVAALGAAVAGVVMSAAPASAHPLGNFTINHYSGLVVTEGGISDLAVVDSAEIPTYAERQSVDADGSGDVSSAEQAAFAAERCPVVASKLELRIDGVVRAWAVDASSFTYRPGQAGLDTSRLECRLSIEADLSQESAIAFQDTYLASRIGWREITLAGEKMALSGASVGSRTSSNELRSYPNALLSSPLDERSVSFSAVPGPSTHDQALPTVSEPGWTSRLLGNATGTLNGFVERDQLTVQVGMLAVLLSLVLGASHALLPGHGKTIMAAYMVGTRGTPKDAVLVGATVTLAHTTGVLVLGLLLSASVAFAGDQVLAVLGVISGVLVAAIGAWLLTSSWKQHHGRMRSAGEQPSRAAGDGHVLPLQPVGEDHHRVQAGSHHHHDDHGHEGPLVHSHPSDASTGRIHRVAAGPAAGTSTLVASDPHHGVASEPAPDATVGGSHDHGQTEGHHPSHDHHHGPGHGHSHSHDKEGAHSHSHWTSPKTEQNGAEARGLRRLTIVGMGLAGGLVPSPTALVVLLGAIALGRTVFGLVLVLAYGIGMAATLTTVGYLIATMPKRLPRLDALRTRPAVARLINYGPLLTACLVVVVGLGLAASSAAPLV